MVGPDGGLARPPRGEGTTDRPSLALERPLVDRAESTALAGWIGAPLILVYAIYVVLHALVTPGGGFQGGAIAASGLSLAFVASGYHAWRRLARSPVLAALEAAGALLFGAMLLAGVPAVTQSPWLAGALTIGYGGIFGLFAGGLVSLRPDHGRYLFKVRDALRQGRSAVVVHARNDRERDGASDLLKARMRNYKRMQERRVVFNIGVLYQTPPEKLEKVPELVKQIVADTPYARFDRTHLLSLGDSALVFEAVYWILDSDYGRYVNAHHRINIELVRRFAAEGIGFAYPSQSLYVEGPVRVETVPAKGQA